MSSESGLCVHLWASGGSVGLFVSVGLVSYPFASCGPVGRAILSLRDPIFIIGVVSFLLM